MQRCYITKAEADKDEVRKITNEILAKGKEKANSSFEQRLSLFCKQAAELKQLQVIYMRSLSAEIMKPDWEESVQPAFWNDETSGVQWLLCIRAFEELREENPAFGNEDQDANAEFELIREHVAYMTNKIDAGVPVEDRYMRELLRNGRSHQHCVSSFLGGIASQEGVKLMMN